jgi:hypothetical protein
MDKNDEIIIAVNVQVNFLLMWVCTNCIHDFRQSIFQLV